MDAYHLHPILITIGNIKEDLAGKLNTRKTKVSLTQYVSMTSNGACCMF